MDWINKYPVKDSKAVFRIIDEQAMVIRVDDKPVGKDEVYVFNPTGTRFWQLLEGEKSVGEIIKIMCDEYEVDYKKAEEEVTEFISDLLKKKLITF